MEMAAFFLPSDAFLIKSQEKNKAQRQTYDTLANRMNYIVRSRTNYISLEFYFNLNGMVHQSTLMIPSKNSFSLHVYIYLIGQFNLKIRF